jgi:L-alanine-DL-glutamate epimerase-like enolase superfamily enzyme
MKPPENMVLATFSNANVQWFYRDWYAPQNGYFELPAGPGFGYELDDAKIRMRSEI